MIDATDTTTLIAIVVALLAAAVVLWLILRGARKAKQRPPVLSERAPDERPYLRTPPAPPPAHGSLADEISTATTDVVGDVLDVDCHMPDALGDNLQLLKGVGPKLASRLRELGVNSYAQLAGLSEPEVARLDDRLGPFKGRVARDRLVDQARYLARGDTDGFEAQFGKLGSAG